jgi:hypothetical protein
MTTALHGALAAIASTGVPADLVATDNTIVGPGEGDGSAGIVFADGATGEMSGNTISNFLDTNAAIVSCGIRIEANAGDMTIGANTFPHPEGSAPGNEQNVCDFRN